MEKMPRLNLAPDRSVSVKSSGTHSYVAFCSVALPLCLPEDVPSCVQPDCPQPDCSLPCGPAPSGPALSWCRYPVDRDCRDLHTRPLQAPERPNRCDQRRWAGLLVAGSGGWVLQGILTSAKAVRQDGGQGMIKFSCY